MKILVAHASNFDYLNELYQPLKKSFLTQEHTFIFPKENENTEIETNSQIPNTDLLIAEVSYPSTGTGIEIGLVQAAHIPTIFLHKKGTTPTSSLKFIEGTIIEYIDSNDLVIKISDYINNN